MILYTPFYIVTQPILQIYKVRHYSNSIARYIIIKWSKSNQDISINLVVLLLLFFLHSIIKRGMPLYKCSWIDLYIIIWELYISIICKYVTIPIQRKLLQTKFYLSNDTHTSVRDIDDETVVPTMISNFSCIVSGMIDKLMKKINNNRFK